MFALGDLPRRKNISLSPSLFWETTSHCTTFAYWVVFKQQNTEHIEMMLKEAREMKSGLREIHFSLFASISNAVDKHLIQQFKVNYLAQY